MEERVCDGPPTSCILPVRLTARTHRRVRQVWIITGSAAEARMVFTRDQGYQALASLNPAPVFLESYRVRTLPDRRGG